MSETDDPADAADAPSTRGDLVLRTQEVCGYALVMSLTAIMLVEERRGERLYLFGRALDDFERGAFEAAVRQARQAAAPGAALSIAEMVHDAEGMRQRLHQLLVRICGRA